MQDSILYIVLILLCIVIYLLIIQKKNKIDENDREEINRLKESLTNSFGQMSKEISKDMASALTRVDEKVGAFNRQIEIINKSQENFSRILAGVKQYGGLAEFSLASLLKDLLPAAQYIANVKMKPEETGDTVEFAIKLQDVLVLHGLE